MIDVTSDEGDRDVADDRLRTGAGTVRERWYVALLAGVAAILGIVATWRGAGMNADSVNYLAAGRSLSETGELTQVTGDTLTAFPPGLPLVAALGESLGVSGQQTVRWFNVACWVGVVVVGWLLVRRTAVRPVVAVGATALLAVSPSLLGISKMVWSEPAFLLVSLGTLLLLGHSWGRDLDRTTLLGLVGTCWVAFLLRYAGVALIATTVVALLVSGWPPTARRIRRTVAFGALASVVPVAWMVRNRVADGTWLGPRRESPDDIEQVARNIGETAVGWFQPVGEVPVFSAGGPLVLLVGLCGCALLVSAHRRAARSAASRAMFEAGTGPLVAFTFVYVGYLAAAQLSTAIDPINSRLMSPVYVPLVVLGAVAADELVGLVRGLDRGRALGWTLVATAAVFVVGQAAVAVRQARDDARTGVYYGQRTWEESDAAEQARIEAERSGAVLTSNEPWGLWAATGVQPLLHAPRRTFYRGATSTGELERFAREVRCADPPVVLVWFDLDDGRATSRYDVHGPDEIAAVVGVEEMTTARDGTLFAVRPARDGGDDC